MMHFAIMTLNRLACLRLRTRVRLNIDKSSEVYIFRISPSGGGILTVGKQSIIRCRFSFDSTGGTITIGNRVFIGNSLLVCHQGIEIGDDVIMSWGITIVDHNSHALDWRDRCDDVIHWRSGKKDWSNVRSSAVVIKSRAWIGFDAVVLKGVTIGEGAVVAARAVVTRDVPPYTVVAGNPARVVRQLEPDHG